MWLCICAPNKHAGRHVCSKSTYAVALWEGVVEAGVGPHMPPLRRTTNHQRTPHSVRTCPWFTVHGSWSRERKHPRRAVAIRALGLVCSVHGVQVCVRVWKCSARLKGSGN